MWGERTLLNKKIIAFAGIFPVVLTLDLITKSWALDALRGGGGPRELFGGLVPLTLAFNRGAAFGITLGSDPRWFFIPVTVIALMLLIGLFVQADRGDLLRIISISLIVSGAVGNLYDRVRWDVGVVDFIGPVNLGFMLWPIFNVADMAISVGAVCLAISFAFEERRERAAAGASDHSPGSPTEETA